MPYIGNTIRAADDYRLIDDISSGFNGSATSFALQVAGSAPVPFPKSPQQVLISVNGVIQEPDPTGSSGFNLVGTNIVFSSAPTNGHAFFGIIYATADYLNAGGNFPAGSLGAPSITFIGDENTGLFRKSGGSVGFVSDATEIANFDSNGITISSGNLIIPDSIIHNGDTDTKIRFGAANTFSVETGGAERLSLGATTVFNETGADVDFRIESDSISSMFFVDAGNNRVGISDGSPSCTFEVGGTTSQTAIFQSNQSATTVSILDTDGDGIHISGGSSFGHRILTSTTEALKFGINNAVKMTLDSNGDLGVGTEAPARKFVVTESTANRIANFTTGGSSGAFVAFLDTNTTDDSKCRVGSKGGNALALRGDTHHFEDGAGSERAQIDSAGRLLIGGTSAIIGSSSEFNEIVLTGKTRGAGITLQDIDANTRFQIRTDDNGDGILLNASTNDLIRVRTNNNTRLEIAADGKTFIDRTHTSQTTGNHPAVDIDTYANGTAGATFATGIDFRVAGVHKKRLAVTNADSSSGTGDWIFYRDNGNNEGLRIQGNGKVGVGTSAPEAKFSVQDASTPDIGLMYSGTSGGHKSRYLFIDKRGFINAQVANNLQDDGSGTGAAHLEFATSHAGTLSTAMAIDRYGKVAIGDELFNANGGKFQVVRTGGGQLDNDNLVYFETNSNDWIIKTNYEDTGTHYHTAYTEHGTIRGTVSGSDGQNVAFTPGSDYRWKENVVDLTGTEGISLLKNLKPRKYNWIDNRLCTGKINTVNGFIAHEVEEAGIAHLVYGNGKDAVFEDGSIDGQTLDYAGMAPVLAAAIKGLIDKVETLETKVAALEAA